MEMNKEKIKIAQNALNGEVKLHEAIESIMPRDDHAKRNKIFQDAIGKEALGAHYRREAIKPDGHAQIDNEKMWKNIYARLSEEEAKKVLEHLLEKQ